MKLYKFRGKGKDGVIHYGSLVQEFIHWGRENVITCAIIENAGSSREQEYEVDAGSVAQLIGYDAFGSEVYEGDSAQIAQSI